MNNRKANSFNRVKHTVQNTGLVRAAVLKWKFSLSYLSCCKYFKSGILTPLQRIHIMLSILKNVMLLQQKALTLVKNSGLLSKLEMSFSPLF